MAVKQPIRLQPRRTGLARVITRRNVPVIALGAIALALAILIFHDLFQPASKLAGLNFATVSSGNVTSTVTSSGSLVPAQTVNLGFKTPGTLTEVDALSGATVKAGQVLAKIDPQPLQLALQQAQASLAAAQASLDNTLSGTSLQQATDQLNQANQAYTNAQNNLNADQATLNTDTATLNLDKTNYWYMQYQPNLTTFQNQLTTAQVAFAAMACPVTTQPSSTPDTTTCPNAADMIQLAQQGIACLQTGSGPTCTPAEQQVAGAYRAEQGQQAIVTGDQAKVNADSSQLQQAANAVASAQDGYNSQAANRPATIQSQQAQVAAAQAQVDTAQTNLDAATLTAPVDGIITSVTGQAGDVVSAYNGTSGDEAPGSTALLPSSGSASSAGGGGGASALMTEVATSAYQTVVSFAESDAAKIQAGQVGQVNFDAISGLSIPVHVLAVAGAATVTSNVVNYYVTLALDKSDPRLRPGLTTNATIVTAEADNVLTLPNAAIIHRGAQAFVTLLQAGKQVLTQVTLGVVGATSTEVMSGLTEGEQVVLPTVSTSAGSTGGGLRTRFGGGGIGLGG